ncbi:MAG: DNA alkylation repair protein [Clostridia bacterium]|nr:DNA alkylation repair protein [Clostridia bacterium]
MNSAENYVRQKLFEMQDSDYRDFHSRLMPTVDKDFIIGVRTPELRKFAKNFSKSSFSLEFLETLPHKYYEENNLHAFMIEQISDYNKCIAELNRFLPYVDNWATCDMMRPKVFKKHLPELLDQIKIWLKSDDVYTLRFGVEMLMCHYLDGNFSEEYPRLVSEIRNDEYYVRMMVAWYFATALAKQYDAVIPYLEKKKLDSDTHKKAVRKALESYRISDDKKAYLRTL